MRGDGQQLGNHRLFGLAAEFDSAEAIVEAARRVHDEGYRCTETYTPFPVTDLPEALGLQRTAMPLIVLVGAIFGAAGGFFMQWFANVIHYPWNAGGKPPNSWPAFIPITFELGILCGAVAGVIGLFVLNRLPKPFHPMFNVERFARASRDRFFICIEADDPKFDPQATRYFLQRLEPLAVMEVPA
jgi:hypothetical protein